MRFFSGPSFHQSSYGIGAVGEPGMSASQADLPGRLEFLRKVYSLFTGAVVLFALTTWWASTSPAAIAFVSSIGWIGRIALFLGLFLVIRATASSFPLNILALGLFAVGEGVLVGPVVRWALLEQGPDVVLQAASLSAITFGVITSYVLTTKKDFAWMRTALWAGFGLLFGIIILSLFGIGTGLASGWGISAAFVALMAGFLIYDTSNVLHRFPPHLAATAACVLFIDLVVFFVHLLRVLVARRS